MLDVEELARTGAILFLLARGASGGRDTAGKIGFFGGSAAGFLSFGSATEAGLDWVVPVVLTFEAFVGEPTPKFHTLRTIDLAEDRIPKRGVALPLSASDNRLTVLPLAREE